MSFHGGIALLCFLLLQQQFVWLSQKATASWLVSETVTSGENNPVLKLSLYRITHLSYLGLKTNKT